MPRNAAPKPQPTALAAGRDWLPLIKIALLILLPGVGFLSSQVIENAQDNAVLKESQRANHAASLTEADSMRLIKHHERDGNHPGYVTQQQLSDVLVQLDKTQAVRDANTLRELTEIKSSLKDLNAQGR